MLEMCARICSTSNVLAELNLHSADATEEELEAIFEALLNNETSSLKTIILCRNPSVSSQNLLELLKLIISNQKELELLDLRGCGEGYEFKVFEKDWTHLNDDQRD